jgi:hypothetical protein
MMDKRLENYVDVPHRIKLFYEKYPNGSLQMDSIQFETIGDQVIVIGKAYAFRTPEDPRPGVGTAQEYFPGKTGFTRGSEIQNLETSCWGRAIGALGIGIDKSIATKEEVELAIERNKQETVTMKRANPGLKKIKEILETFGHSPEEMIPAVSSIIGRDIASSNDLTDEEVQYVLEHLTEVSSS